MKVYVGDDKNGPVIAATAVALVRYRITEMYQHLGEPEVVERAERVVQLAAASPTSAERAAIRLLQEREAGEYEGYRVEDVLT